MFALPPSPSPVLALALWDSTRDFFEAGGPFMVPLALCAGWAVVVTIQRFLALRRELVMPRFLKAAIERLPAGTDTGHLWQLAERSPAALARITQAALRHLDYPKEENTAAVQAAARRELMRLERGLSVLELIVGISPLLGLLGAISGLVGVFSNLAAEGGQAASNTAGVALGIAEALNTTIFGLAIAIPTLIVYTFLTRRVERLAVEMESMMAGLLTKCYVEEPAPGAADVSFLSGVPAAPAASYQRPAVGHRILSSDSEPTGPSLMVEEVVPPAAVLGGRDETAQGNALR